MVSRAQELAAYRELTRDTISAIDLRYFYTYRYLMGDSAQHMDITEARLQAFSPQVHAFFANQMGPFPVPANVRAEMEASVRSLEANGRLYNIDLSPYVNRTRNGWYNVASYDIVMPNLAAFYAREGDLWMNPVLHDFGWGPEPFVVNELYLKFIARLVVEVFTYRSYAILGAEQGVRAGQGVVYFFEYFGTPGEAAETDVTPEVLLGSQRLAVELTEEAVLDVLREVTRTNTFPSRQIAQGVIRVVAAQRGTGAAGNMPPHLKKKKFVWSSPLEGRCLQASVVVMLCKIGDHAKYRSITRSEAKLEEELADFCLKTGVTAYECDYTHVRQIAVYLHREIVVLCSSTFTQLYSSHEDDASGCTGRLFLLHDRLNKHFIALFNPDSLVHHKKWCFVCKRLTSLSHRCVEKCWACKQPDPDKVHFKHVAEWVTHDGPEGCWRVIPGSCYLNHVQHCNGARKKCQSCGETFWDAAVVPRHPAAISAEEHARECGNNFRVCSVCKKLTSRDHPCALLPFDEKVDYNPEKDKRALYVFDIECYREDDGKQVPNIISVRPVVKSLEGEDKETYIMRALAEAEELVFYTLKDFCEWFVTQKKSDFIAHNLKGYDGTLVCGYLRYTMNLSVDVTYSGLKIMHAAVGSNNLCDSLNHLAGALDALPKTLGILELVQAKGIEFGKGFFPYAFNTEENKNYVGPLPDKKFFEPEHMSRQRRVAFEQWFVATQAEFADKPYDIVEQGRLYCGQDTRILALCVGEYRRLVLELTRLDPWKCMTVASLALKIFRRHHLREEGIEVLTEAQAAFARLAFKGGRTECFKTQAHDVPIKVLDVVSMYPTVQFYDPLPGHFVGTFLMARPDGQAEGPAPASTPPPPDGWLHSGEFEGFLQCDLIPPTGRGAEFIPVIGETKRFKYIFDCTPKLQQVFTLAEVRRALDTGYTIDNMTRVDLYEADSEYFKSYVSFFLKIKQDSSPDGAAPNPGMRALAKLFLNSLWGKLGQREYGTSKLCNITEYEALMDKDARKHIKIEGIRIDPIDARWIHVKYFDLEDNSKKTRFRTNVAIAAYVTAQARLRLYSVIGNPLLRGRVLYCDTDSCIYECPEGSWEPEQGRELGEWEVEDKYAGANHFICTGPKFYILWGEDPAVPQKRALKGVPSAAAEAFTPTAMRRISEGEKVSVTRHNVTRTLRDVNFGKRTAVYKETVDGKRKKVDGSYVLAPFSQ